MIRHRRVGKRPSIQLEASGKPTRKCHRPNTSNSQLKGDTELYKSIKEGDSHMNWSCETRQSKIQLQQRRNTCSLATAEKCTNVCIRGRVCTQAHVHVCDVHIKWVCDVHESAHCVYAYVWKGNDSCNHLYIKSLSPSHQNKYSVAVGQSDDIWMGNWKKKTWSS